jgi:hypothetical protein
MLSAIMIEDKCVLREALAYPAFPQGAMPC